MALEQKLSLKLAQKLVMTPSLQQAIKLLQMTRMELETLLTQELVERLEVIVRFLAVLELYKSGLVDLEQGGNFADLQITWLGDEAETLESVGLIDIEEYQG